MKFLVIYCIIASVSSALFPSQIISQASPSITTNHRPSAPAALHHIHLNNSINYTNNNSNKTNNSNIKIYKKKRNAHNLYRIINKACHVLQACVYKIGRLLRINKSKANKNILPILFDPGWSDNLNNQTIITSIKSIFVRKQKARPFIQTFKSIFMINNRNGTYKSFQFFNKNNLASKKFIIPTTWGGIKVTENERKSLTLLNKKRLDSIKTEKISQWLCGATGTDFLRFLRVKNGNVDDAYNMILSHAKWRLSKDGADTIIKSNKYKESVLKNEIFWLGMNKHKVPTLVIRTQAHDGVDYNEDPKVFTRFVYMVFYS